MQDMKSFMAKYNNGEVPKVFETSTGRMQLIVKDSMTLPKIFGVQKLKLDTVADLDPLWVWVGSPKEAPTEVIYIVGPMSKMKEKVLK